MVLNSHRELLNIPSNLTMINYVSHSADTEFYLIADLTVLQINQTNQQCDNKTMDILVEYIFNSFGWVLYIEFTTKVL